VAEAEGITCEQLASSAAKSTVAAAVTLTLSSLKLRAGGCVRAAIGVQPNKSGRHVSLQQRGPTGWRTFASLTLDASSHAATKLCRGWSSVGKRLTLRARWPAQDTLNVVGVSGRSILSVVEANWMLKIDRLTKGRTVGVSIRSNGRILYDRAADVPFAPASNEKLLLSMALLDRLGPSFTIRTDAGVPRLRHGVVHGNLWILGHGDPSTGKHDIGVLAHRISSAGVQRVTGSVMGSTSYFRHDWFAPGWKSFYQATEVGLPSALTFLENHVHGHNVHRPERYAARALTRRLRNLGVRVAGRPGSGAPPGGLQRVASVTSPSLVGLMTHMDHFSDNFFAEVLGKRLAVAVSGAPGTIAHAAAAISSWTQAHGVPIHVYDSSGLSYSDRVTPGGITKLLQFAQGATWGPTLRSILPSGGQGTLEGRLTGVRVHAKTGTLDYISALSGWVWLSQLGSWAQFSILDRGMAAWYAKDMEDGIVRATARYGH
jgi:D-alanyl-D-alanine carboxypeptidase